MEFRDLRKDSCADFGECASGPRFHRICLVSVDIWLSDLDTTS